MAPSNDTNAEIDRSFRQLEHVYNTYSNAKATESNKHPLNDPQRVEADLSELEKAHLNLLQSRLNATIAQEQIKGMAKSSSESAIFSKRIFVLNIVIALSTLIYTWITWRSVSAAREGNDIQRQILQIQKPK